MSITTIHNYKYEDFKLKEKAPLFEVTEIKVDTHCQANKNEITDTFKVFWIEDGSGNYTIDFKSFDIVGAGVFCLSPGQVFSVNSEKVKSAYMISFDKNFYCIETHGKEIACNGLLFNNVHRATAISISRDKVSIFTNLIDQMITELKAKGSAHQEMLESYLRMFLIQTLRLVDEQELAQTENSHQQDKLVQKFIALVEKHFKEIHSVKEYAELLFISPKSLAKKLKLLNYPRPLELIRDRILLDAKRSLKFSQDNVKEIAYDLGFEDPAYFSRLFSKKEKMTPLEYRNS